MKLTVIEKTKERHFDLCGKNTIVIVNGDCVKIQSINQELYDTLKISDVYEDYYFEAGNPTEISVDIIDYELPTEDCRDNLLECFYRLCNVYKSIRHIRINSNWNFDINFKQIANPDRIVSLDIAGLIPDNFNDVAIFKNIVRFEFSNSYIYDPVDTNNKLVDIINILNKDSMLKYLLLTGSSIKYGRILSIIKNTSISYLAVRLCGNEINEELELIGEYTDLTSLKLISKELVQLPSELLSKLYKLESLDISETGISADTYELCVEINNKWGIKNVKIPQLIIGK